MKKTRPWTTAIAAASALTIGLTTVIALPHAAVAATLTNITTSGSGTVTVAWSGTAPTFTPQNGGNQLDICIVSPPGMSVACTRLNSLYYVNLVGTSITLSEGMAVTDSQTNNPTTLAAGNYELAVYDVSSGSSGGVLTLQGSLLQVCIGTGGCTGGGTNNGGTSSGAAASAPVEVSLSLDLATSGASCTEGSSATGVAGAWMTLPGADSCTSQTTPDANLLGWATTADFPVDIAQRQIDNGWGAYELFNEEGRMTAVFIPAGQATFVSGPNSLHPIWAS
ncbi:MAG TPA: hypothetical protein VIG24_03535 [Acidimicrobiia bacterium]